MMLELNDICVCLSGKSILQSISFTAGDGEFVSVLGESGCGKTTLLKAVTGIVPLAGGCVMMEGKNTEGVPPNKRGAVILFQDFRLFPHMTVEENIAFPLKIKGIKKDSGRIVANLLENVQMRGYEKRMPNELSGGQMQRVALARALAAKPSILLLDEPFSNLDENLRAEMRKLVQQLQRDFKITTIMVTHDRQEALSMSDKIALLKHGRLLQYDTPQGLYNTPANREVADYFGEAIYIEGKVKASFFISEFLSFPVQKEEGQYAVLLRPSQLHVAQDGKKDYIIREVQYIGDYYRIGCEHISGKLAVWLTIPEGQDLTPGERMGVRIDCSKAILFPG